MPHYTLLLAWVVSAQRLAETERQRAWDLIIWMDEQGITGPARDRIVERYVSEGR